MNNICSSTEWFLRIKDSKRVGVQLGIFAIWWLFLISLKAEPPRVITIVSAQGKVEVSRSTNATWEAASTTFPGHILRSGDSLRTGERSRSAIQLSNLTIKQMGPNSHLTVLPPRSDHNSFKLLQGIFSFFHRDEPTEVEIESPVVAMTIRGTEFQVSVDSVTGATQVQLFDGQVEMINAFGSLMLNGPSAGLALPGKRPERTAVIELSRSLQWSLYYPAVLDASELPLTPSEQSAIAASIAAYTNGDLLGALAAYPQDRRPDSGAERVYLAALLLSVGETRDVATLLPSTNTLATAVADVRVTALAQAVEHWMRFIQGESSRMSSAERQGSTEWLVESYLIQGEQAGGSAKKGFLYSAKEAAEGAVAISPKFGFGWVRLAELEFAFGHRKAALAALEHALQYSPLNPQAHSLRGFLLLSERKHQEAMNAFERALALDSHLGNAWLGRGLGRIRQGDMSRGRADLEIAAALEPNRSILRSYLAKAWSEDGDIMRALDEARRAQQLDPHDPTAWLYSALLLEQENRFNQAIQDLNHSIELNDNRRLYRSRFLLDQDRGVRGANLARVYKEAGLMDVAIREASNALESDYGNPAAHLFLANSYQSFRDENRVNLRYETPTFREFLISSLLNPVGAGSLSPYVTLQEYSRLFDRDHVGFSASTEYFSNGRWAHRAANYGVVGTTSYSVEGSYDFDPGLRSNNDLRARSSSMRIKQELGSADTVYVDASLSDFVTGDRAEYQYPEQANTALRIRETQEPIVIAGYHHEWSPESHTLFLGGKLKDDLNVVNPDSRTWVTHRDVSGNLFDAVPIAMHQDYTSGLGAYLLEMQQIVTWQNQTLLVGGRWQSGEFDLTNRQRDPVPAFIGSLFPPGNPPVSQDQELSFLRRSAYAYDHAKIGDQVTVIGGVSYDRLRYPEDHRFAPISSKEVERDQWSPKAGLLWNPSPRTTFRGAVTRSLGGVTFDQSYQLEPAQIAGFNQAFRSLMPESVVGANSAESFESAGIAWDQKLDPKTFLTLQADWLHSTLNRSLGLFDLVEGSAPIPTLIPSQTRESLAYLERSVALTAHRLLDDFWSISAGYRISHAKLEDHFPDIPSSLMQYFLSRNRSTSLIQEVNAQLRFNHSSGFFATLDGMWTHQEDRVGRNEDFFQENVFVGYRFPKRRAEIRAGVINLGQQDYHLDPLNLISGRSRARMFTVGVSVNL